MPDISMCKNGEKCIKRDTCYRYKVCPDKYQSYSMFYEEGKECIYYLKYYEWHNVQNGDYPMLQLVSQDVHSNSYASSPVLVQTKRGEMFVATYREKQSFGRCEKDWISYGTGGRPMKVMSKVIAWMPLPEKFVK